MGFTEPARLRAGDSQPKDFGSRASSGTLAREAVKQQTLRGRRRKWPLSLAGLTDSCGGPPSCEGPGPGLRSLSLPAPQTTAQRCEREKKKQGEGWQRKDRCTFHTLTTGGARSSFTLTNFLLKLPPWRLRRPEAEGHSHQNSGCRPLARWVFPRTRSAWDLVWGLLGTRGRGQIRGPGEDLAWHNDPGNFSGR